MKPARQSRECGEFWYAVKMKSFVAKGPGLRAMQKVVRSGAVLALGLSTGLVACGSGVTITPAAVAAEKVFDSQLNSSTVFIGDSITAHWPLPIHNDGVPGQDTRGMLAGFQANVLQHGYKRVVILGGTNDIWFNYEGLSDTIAHIAAMGAMAQAAGIEVVLCTIPPLNAGGVDRTKPVTMANDAIRELARQQGYRLVDYYGAMLNNPQFFLDGVHPNQFGYDVMHATLSLVLAGDATTP
jgi:lysophospholipase L1-like esterase